MTDGSQSCQTARKGINCRLQKTKADAHNAQGPIC